MDGKILARIVAVIFVAAAITATAIGMTRKEDSAGRAAPGESSVTVPNPDREALRRCQGLGAAALRDDHCLLLWGRQRDRFLGVDTPSMRPSAGPGPQSPDAAMPEAR